MNPIVDYQKNDKAITVPDQEVVHRGQSFIQKYNVGWQLCVQCRDGSMSSQALKDLKESHPV